MDQARALYAESLAAEPNNLNTLLGLVRLEEAGRNLETAATLLDRAEALEPGNSSVLLLRAMVLGRQGDAAAALAVLDRTVATPTTLGPGESLEKGRLLDRMGRYPEAFAAFEAGKTRLREVSGQTYRQAYAQQHAARLTKFFTAERLAALPRATRRADVAQPLFVLGFRARARRCSNRR